MTRRATMDYLFLMSILMLVLVACGGEEEKAIYDLVSPASIEQGDPIPPPSDEVILTLRGDISITNDRGQLSFDMETLEMLGQVSYVVSDPWLQREVTYSGVLLSDLLRFAGTSKNVTEVFAGAMDGYAIAIPMDEIEEWPVLVATQSDGSYMTIENSGPTRIIFPYDLLEDITAARNYSVWNLETLEIR